MRIKQWLLLLTAVVALTAWACGGGDDKTIDIPGGGQVNVSDDIPDEFPDDFPIYDGADFQTSFSGEQDGVEGLIATWQTDDSFDDVKAFFDGEFEGGSWTSTGDGTTGSESAFWSVQNADNDKGGFVTIVTSDGKTAISVVISDDLSDLPTGDGSSGDDSSSGDDDSSGDDSSSDGDDSSSDDSSDPPSAELPDEADLPDDFPSDVVPLPDDIRVTNASSFSTGGVESFIIEFYSKDSVDDLATHFKDGFEGKGWSQSFQTESDGQVYATYAENADATGAVVTVTISESEVDGYNNVGLTVTTNPTP